MIRKTVVVIFSGLTVFFGWAYYIRYFKWRDCFNELGRCFDPDTGDVMLEQAGMIWGTAAALCFVIAAYQIRKIRKLRAQRR